MSDLARTASGSRCGTGSLLLVRRATLTVGREAGCLSVAPHAAIVALELEVAMKATGRCADRAQMSQNLNALSLEVQ